MFIETNRFGKSPQYSPSRSEALSPATNNAKHIMRAALTALKHIYREGLVYKRAGVMLLGLAGAGRAPISLFDTQDPRDDKLIGAFDAIIELAPRLPMAACTTQYWRRWLQLSLHGPAVPAPSASVTPPRARA